MVYWISQAWEETETIILERLWLKALLINEDGNVQNEDNCIDDTRQENWQNLVPLLQQIPDSENVNNEDVHEWMDKDEQ